MIDLLSRVISAIGRKEERRSGEGVIGRYITPDERGKVVEPRYPPQQSSSARGAFSAPSAARSPLRRRGMA